jgi:AcrR family transcriptional regulator
MLKKKDRGKSQKKKGKISRSAMQLFLKKGSYSATSTTDICSAARISRPSLYHYFGNKSNLLFSLHTDYIIKVLKPYLEKAASIADPLDRLTYMIQTYTCDIICRQPELRFLIHDVSAIQERNFIEVRQEWKKHYSLLRSTIEELKNQGRAREGLNESWAALFILGMITWITFWFKYNRPDQIDQVGDAAVDFVLQGLNCGFNVQCCKLA